ncbi:hypothetical protein lerEdw1_000180 [Lerista edwardsae]|nr:hypothetical protein lerEdw1_000180 [Lerista edwardsae]
MYWRQNARFILTVTLALLSIPFGKGNREAGSRHDTGENTDAIARKHHAKTQVTTRNVLDDTNQSYGSRKERNSLPVVPFIGLTNSRHSDEHIQVKHWSGIAVKMEEPVSLVAFVPARNPSLADIVNMMNGRAAAAHSCMENGSEWVANYVDVFMVLCTVCPDQYRTVEDVQAAEREEEKFIHLPSNSPRLQQTMCLLVLLLGCFFALFCTKLLYLL